MRFLTRFLVRSSVTQQIERIFVSVHTATSWISRPVYGSQYVYTQYIYRYIQWCCFVIFFSYGYRDDPIAKMIVGRNESERCIDTWLIHDIYLLRCRYEPVQHMYAGGSCITYLLRIADTYIMYFIEDSRNIYIYVYIFIERARTRFMLRERIRGQLFINEMNSTGRGLNRTVIPFQPFNNILRASVQYMIQSVIKQRCRFFMDQISLLYFLFRNFRLLTAGCVERFGKITQFFFINIQAIN